MTARGQTFIGERRYPKGSKAPELGIETTIDELVLKFRNNAQGVIPAANIDGIVEAVLNLDSLENVRSLMHLVGPNEGVGTSQEARALAAE